MFDEENLIVEMLEAGASGYLLKNAHKDEIIEAIKSVNDHLNYYCNDTSAKLAQMIAKSQVRENEKNKKPDFSEKDLAVIRYICQEMTSKAVNRQATESQYPNRRRLPRPHTGKDRRAECCCIWRRPSVTIFINSGNDYNSCRPLFIITEIISLEGSRIHCAISNLLFR